MSATGINSLLESAAVKPDAKPEDLVGRMATASELADNKEVVKEVLKYGKVPIVYAPTKAMLRKPKEPGLIQLIENAMTEKEVLNLVKNGKEKYKNVSSGTVRKWDKASQARISFLNKKK